MRTSRPGWLLALAVGLALASPSAVSVAGEKGSPAARKAPRKLDYIDAMIRDSWEGASIKPSPLASDADFLRRAYLDILGRIPTVQEALAFLESKEPSASRRLKLVDYL